MSALPITITTAGLQALINAQNSGVSNVVIAALGVCPNQVAITAATTVIPGELKRLGAVAGLVTAEDTIYVSATDQTQDIYTVRTVALYLGDGTLFAAYSQAAPLVEKAGPAQAVLEASIKLSTPLAGVIEFEGGGWLNPPASETVAGVLRLATVDEALAGVNHSKAVTAKGLKAVTSAMMAAIQATLDQIVQALAGKANNGHQHGAGDVTSGTFNEARIPELPMTRIGGLIATLGEKAQALHSHTMAQVGGLTAAFDSVWAAIGLKANADAANLTGIARISSFFLGTGRAYVYPAGDGLNVRVGAAGAESYLSFTSQGNVLLNGGPMWHLGNFDPDSRVSVAATNLGKTVNVPLTTLSSAAQYAALPIGFSSMVAPGSVGTPGGYGYLFKMARRDSNDGWSGLWINHTAELGDAPELFIGTALVGSVLPVWTRAWTTANFDPTTKAPVLNPSFRGISWFGTDRPGKINIQGADDRAGVLEFHGTDGRVGFLGYGDGPNGNPYLGTDGGRCWLFQTRPSFNGATPWDGNNLKFAVGGDITNPAVGPNIHDQMLSPAGLWAFARSIGASGYAQIPGTPIIMQWGSSTGSLIEGQVTALLPIAFGGGCFFAAATPRNANSEPWADFMMQVVAKYLDRITFYAQRGYDGRNTSSGYEWLALGFATGTPNAAFSAGGGTGGGGGGGEMNPEL